MLFDGFDHIAGTGWVEAAVAAQHWAYQILIAFNKADQNQFG